MRRHPSYTYLRSAKKWYRKNWWTIKQSLSKKRKTTKQVVVVGPPIKKRSGEMGLGEMLPNRLQDTALIAAKTMRSSLAYRCVLHDFCWILSSIVIWRLFRLTSQLLTVFMFSLFSFFSYFSCLYFSHFSNFVSFTLKTVSILSISHFIFLLNIYVFFSLCARLNWQCVCQFLSANFSLYCILFRHSVVCRFSSSLS